MTSLDAVKARKESWEILTQDLEAQILSVQTVLLPELIRSFLLKDPILTVIAIEELCPAIQHTLAGNFVTIELIRSVINEDPTDEELAPIIDGLNNDLKKVQVQSEKIGAFMPSAPEQLEGLNEFQIFVRTLTAKQYELMDMNELIRSAGLTNFFNSTNIRFTEEMVKTAILTAMFLSGASNAAQTTPIAAKAGDLLV